MSLSVSRVSTHSWWIQLFELIRAYTLLHTVFLLWKANDATHTANSKETWNATYSKKFSFYNIFSFKLSISIFINNLTLNLRVPLWTVLQELLWSLLAKAMQDFSVTHGGREGEQTDKSNSPLQHTRDTQRYWGTTSCNTVQCLIKSR